MKENPRITTYNDFISAEFLLGNVGAPFVIGAAVGYFAKKMLKAALFIGGGAIVLLFIAEYYQIIHIQDADLQQAANSVAHSTQQAGDYLFERLKRITSQGVSAIGGFALGFRWG